VVLLLLLICFAASRSGSIKPIAENKWLGSILAMTREEQLHREPERRSGSAPRRRYQHNARLFRVG